jgi:hypothetical protein
MLMGFVTFYIGNEANATGSHAQMMDDINPGYPPCLFSFLFYK